MRMLLSFGDDLFTRFGTSFASCCSENTQSLLTIATENEPSIDTRSASDEMYIGLDRAVRGRTAALAVEFSFCSEHST